MDLESQEAISRLAEKHGADQLLVLIGAPDPEAAEISAETVVLGDPAYAGALAGVQLGLDVYHVLEEPVKNSVPEDVWEDQIGVQSDILEAEELAEAVAKMREQKPESDSGSDGQAKSGSDESEETEEAKSEESEQAESEESDKAESDSDAGSDESGESEESDDDSNSDSDSD